MHHHLFAIAAAWALSGCAYGPGMHGGLGDRAYGHGMHGGMHGAEGAPICGEHMMSAEERDEHHRRMREASSAAERDRIRQEHHDKMIARARQHGTPWRDGPGCRGPVGTS